MLTNTTGTSNNAFGYQALTSNINGSGNNAFGTQALAANKNSSNSAFGFRALASNISGYPNSAFGYQALTSNVSGNFNNAFGMESLRFNVSGTNNNAFGTFASYSNTGNDTNAFGSGALSSNTNSSNNAFGHRALESNTLGTPNNAFGTYALASNTLGGNNTAFGHHALLLNETGNANNAFGSRALAANINSSNSAFGFQALAANTTGTSNNAFGHQALTSNINGSANNAFGSQALTSNINSSNSAFGFQALTSNTTGTSNNAFGYQALTSNINGSANNAFGSQALTSNTNSSNNAFGFQSLAANTGGASNNAFGYQALRSNINGSANNAFGSQALAANTNSSNNAFGFQTLAANTTGTSNNAFGYQALTTNTTGAGNNAFGNQALTSNTNSSNNAFGFQALAANTGGASNNAFGFQALTTNTTGAGNNAFGTRALAANTNSSNNAFGFQALAANTGGASNNAFGFQALTTNLTGGGNNAFGNQALAANTNSSNNAFGFQALAANTTGTSNNAFGFQALRSNIDGSGNNAFGSQALTANTNSSNNAFGFRALAANTTGTSNNAFGFQALTTNLTGAGNNAFGNQALTANTTGTGNNAFGYQALSSNLTGTGNNAFGQGALINNTGSNNTAFGNSALNTNTTGSNNTAIGNNAQVNGASNSTAIGYNATTSKSNQIVLGTSAETVYVPGIFQSPFANISSLNVSNITTEYFVTNNISNNNITYSYNQNTTSMTNYNDSFAFNFSTRSFLSLVNSVNISDVQNSYFGQNVVLSRNASTIAIGTPYYNSFAGRIDIFMNNVSVRTVIGDAPNSYFGTNIVVSDNGRSVLMGSPNYRGGCGIFNQFYDGVLNYSVIGPATNLQYGKNMYFDMCGNSVMYSNASVTNWTHYTLFGVSPTGNRTLNSNMSTRILINNSVTPNTTTVTATSLTTYKTIVHYFTNDIFKTGTYQDMAALTTTTTTAYAAGYYSSTPFTVQRVTTTNAVYKQLWSIAFTTYHYNVLPAILQPGFFLVYATTTTNIDIQYQTSKANGDNEGINGAGAPSITLSSPLDNTGIIAQVNNKNILMVYIPSSSRFYIYSVRPNTDLNGTPSIFLYWNQTGIPSVNKMSLAYNASVMVMAQPYSSNNVVAINLDSTPTDILNATIPNYQSSYTYGTKTTNYYTPNVAIDASGTTVVASSPYNNGIVQVYQNFSSTNRTPLSSINISGIPDINYGQTIAVNASGTFLVTSAPNYNKNAGLVQYFDLRNITATPINRYITNISTQMTYNIFQDSSNNVLSLNNKNVLTTSNLTTRFTKNINTSIYNASLANNLSVINSSSIIDSIQTTAVRLTLGSDSEFTQLVLGNSGTTVTVPGNLNVSNITTNNTYLLNQNLTTTTNYNSNTTYNFSTANYSTLNSVNISGETNSYFGQNVVISRNATTIAIGTPTYNSNAGRIDIFMNNVSVRTVIGDAPNSYFGDKIVVSDNGTTVLMGSPNYRGGCGIFNQFYDGVLNFSVIGTATNLLYGKNMYVDQSGNGVMYSNASTTSWSDYTIVGVSPTANITLFANMSTQILTNNNGTTVISATNWYPTYKRFIYFVAINILKIGSAYCNMAWVSIDTTPHGSCVNGDGYYTATPTHMYLFISNLAVKGNANANHQYNANNIKYMNVVLSPAQPGFASIIIYDNTLARISYFNILASGLGVTEIRTYDTNNSDFGISGTIDSNGAVFKMNNKNYILLQPRVPVSGENVIFVWSVTPNGQGTPSIANAARVDNVLATGSVTLAYDANIFAYSTPESTNNIKMYQAVTNPTANIILSATIPNYNPSNKTYYTPNIALDASGTVLVASTPYNDYNTGIVQVYQNYSLTNFTPLPSISIIGRSGINYGKTIAMNALGTFFVTSADNYNNTGLVQYFALSNIATSPIQYITNIQAQSTYSTYQNISTDVIKMNNQNVLSTSYVTNNFVTNTDVKIYNPTLSESYVNTSTTTTTNSTLIIGNASSTITMYSPPIMAYTSFTAPTNSYQVGYTIVADPLNDALQTISGPANGGSITLTPGVWIVVGVWSFSNLGTPCLLSLSLSSGKIDRRYTTNSNSQMFMMQVTRVVTITSNTSNNIVYIVVQSGVANSWSATTDPLENNTPKNHLYATRIA